MVEANLEASQWERDWLCVGLSGVTEVDLTRVTIQLWQLSKQQEGQVMTQQTTPAWLTRYILSAGVNEFRVRVFVSFTAYVNRCLTAIQMASMLLPSSTCCSLVTLPLLWLSRASATPPNPPPFLFGYKTSLLSPSLVGQSWHILLKCLVHTGDRLVCLNCGNEMLFCVQQDTAPQHPRWCSYTVYTWLSPQTVAHSLWSSLAIHI